MLVYLLLFIYWTQFLISSNWGKNESKNGNEKNLSNVFQARADLFMLKKDGWWKWFIRWSASTKNFAFLPVKHGLFSLAMTIRVYERMEKVHRQLTCLYDFTEFARDFIEDLFFWGKFYIYEHKRVGWYEEQCFYFSFCSRFAAFLKLLVSVFWSRKLEINAKFFFHFFWEENIKLMIKNRLTVSQASLWVPFLPVSRFPQSNMSLSAKVSKEI